MPMDSDIKAAIEKNLSAEIGTVLKERLAQAERIEILNRDLKDKLDEGDLINKNLKKELDKFTSLEDQTKKAEAAAQAAKDATTDKRIVELIEKHSNEKVALMSQLVSLVFQNQKFKYTIQDGGSTPVSGGNGGFFTANHSRTITGEGDGAPPPPPASGP
jgi:predicted RNase H-like nuclease (RuvC/YqgF family)